MDYLLYVIIIVLAGYIIWSTVLKEKPLKVQAPKEEPVYPYEKKNLLTKTEYAFFKVLKDFCKEKDLLFCPKVRMEDFLNVTDKQNLAKYRGYIKSRHIDFVLCDSNLHILCGIELDDKSHEKAKSQKTDFFKNKVFEQIKLPLFRIKTEDNYRIELERIYDMLFKKEA